MKKKLLALLLPISLVLPGIFAANQAVNESLEVEATTPEYNIPVEEGEELDYENEFFDDFSSGIDPDKWYLKDRAWGQNATRSNGGVVPENVFYDSDAGTAILRSAGDYYAEDKISPAGHGSPKSPNGTRTGADLVSHFWTYPGRYEVRMKVVPRFGSCTAMWTYIEYAETAASGDHHNHEIDIELPWYGDFRRVSFGNYASLSDHTSEKVNVDYLNDDEFHTFGFDWYYNSTTGCKKINYYIDGSILSSITTSIPFYKTKVNIGVWVPDSAPLGGTPPRYDQAFMDVDYFKYIPFKNNDHIDSDYPSTYVIKDVADPSEYPTQSTPNLDRNYFPNGKFDYVEKRDSSDWTDSSITGIAFSNATVKKQTYDRYGSSNSGGVFLTENSGNLTGYIDSCHKGQTYTLSCDYKYNGTATVSYFDASDQLISSQPYTISNSTAWSKFEQVISMVDNTAYIAVSFDSGSSGLILDNIRLDLGEPEPVIEDKTTNHFMTLFPENNVVLSAFNTTSGQTSVKKSDVILNDADYTSAIDWRVSVGKYEDKTVDRGDYSATLLLGSYSNSISDSSDPTYQNIYNAVAASETLSGKQSVIHSLQPIENITDISLYWRNAEVGRIYIVYKYETSASWNYLTSFSTTNKGEGTNSNQSFNQRQLVLDVNHSDFASQLFGRNAQIGFMFSTNNPSEDVVYLCLTGMYVNRVKSMMAKQDYWNEHSSAVCTALANPKSSQYTDLYFTNYKLTTADAGEMNVAIESKPEVTYYQQFAYLCGIAGISVNASPSFMISKWFSNVDPIQIIVIALSVTCAIMITATVITTVKTKRKEN